MRQLRFVVIGLLAAAVGSGCGRTTTTATPSPSIPASSAAPSPSKPSAVDDPSCQTFPVAISAPAEASYQFAVSVRVCQAAGTGSDYWLVAVPDVNGAMGNRYFPKAKVNVAVGTVGSVPVMLAGNTTPQSTRRLLVLRVPSSEATAMEDCIRRNCNRALSEFPTGTAAVSNAAESKLAA